MRNEEIFYEEIWEITDLPCDICSQPMRLNRKRRTLQCTSLSCRQTHDFIMGHGFKIVGKMYPPWEKMSQEMKLEALDYRASEMAFSNQALLILGDITQDQFEAYRKGSLAAVEKQKGDVISEPTLTLWQRIKEFFDAGKAAR